MVIQDPMVMVVIRAFHGLTGGLLVGIGFAIISRTQQADKTFGYLLLIQWSLGGFGIMYLPGLVPEYGTGALFLSLVSFTLVTLIMLPFLPNYLVGNHHVDNEGTQSEKAELAEKSEIRTKPLLLNLFAIFLFQAANMGLFAYMISLGKAEGLSIPFMSNALGVASWVALLGALLVILVGTKYGRTIPLVIAILLTAFCSWLLHFSEIADVYLITNIIIGITWAFVLPYLFGICAELDKAGQMAAMGGFASKMGLASGPMVAALLFGSNTSEPNYAIIINIAVFALVMCAAGAIQPARLLDNKSEA
jgi:predicted MFS family arabinose efflux permease